MALTDEQKICKQVNFYFSDSNLPYDKFLWTLHSNSTDGWIPIQTIASFKKMKMITEDFDAVVKALKDTESEIYEIDEEGKNIRRKSEVKEQDHKARSIYVKGFPLVDAETAAEESVVELFKLQDKIDELFSEKGKVLAVRLKKEIERPNKFKGSAYVEFETPEKAKEVAELKDLELDGNKLEITYRPVYHEQKAKEYADSPPQRKQRKFTFNAFKAVNSQPVTSNKRKNARSSSQKEKKTKTEEPKSEEPKTEEEKAE